MDIEDLGQPSIECEMCESQTIRYVHHMEHDGYPNILQVGCVCAGHMEGDVAASKARETAMKSRSAKRKRWLSRTWRISAKGNAYLNANGYRVTVYQRGSGWAHTVASIDGSSVHYSRRNFTTIIEAKLAAFDQITKLLT